MGFLVRPFLLREEFPMSDASDAAANAQRRIDTKALAAALSTLTLKANVGPQRFQIHDIVYRVPAGFVGNLPTAYVDLAVAAGVGTKSAAVGSVVQSPETENDRDGRLV